MGVLNQPNQPRRVPNLVGFDEDGATGLRVICQHWVYAVLPVYSCLFVCRYGGSVEWLPQPVSVQSIFAFS